MKKYLIVLVTAMMLVFTAFAVSADDFDFNDAAQTADLVAYLESEAPVAGDEYIDVSNYNIRVEDELLLEQLCVDRAPLLFQFERITEATDPTEKYVTDILFIFKAGYDPDSYRRDVETVKAVGGELLLGIKDNSKLDDVTKALLLYDRLNGICRYDHYRDEEGNVAFGSNTIYGPFIKGEAICTGYTSAYMYLLRQIGIDSNVVRSVNEKGWMIHAWLTVNIDGVLYHADPTYDDSEPDTLGRMSHDYFLISSDRINGLGNDPKYHKHNFELTDTRYQDRYWTKSDSQLQLVGDYIYYMDCLSSNKEVVLKGLYCVDASDRTYTPIQLLALNEYWIVGKNEAGSYVAYDKYYCLSTDGTDLFYSTPKHIYIYDISESEAKKVYTPELDEYVNIYGFKYEDGYFVYSRHNLADFGYDKEAGLVNDTAYQVRVEYDPDSDGSGNNGDGNNGDGNNGDGNHGDGNNGDGNNGDGNNGDGNNGDGNNGDGNNGDGNNGDGGNDKPDPDDPFEMKFIDVKENHWFYSAVEYVAKNGYMNGMSETVFSPNGKITREQFVLILANIAGVDTTQYRNMISGMTDVPTGQWYSGAVAWAVKSGYVSGMTPTTFGRGKDITRAQLARLFYVYAEKNGIDVTGRADLSRFADSDKVQNWMRDGLSWAVKAGIISGMEINGQLSLNPNGSATRAQAAVMLRQFDAYKGE